MSCNIMYFMIAVVAVVRVVFFGLAPGYAYVGITLFTSSWILGIWFCVCAITTARLFFYRCGINIATCPSQLDIVGSQRKHLRQVSTGVRNTRQSLVNSSYRSECSQLMHDIDKSY